MKLSGIPFGITDWSTVERSEHHWRTRHFCDIRVRMVEYSAGYLADHCCDKGHILLCLSGRLDTELADGRTFVLTPSTSYQVADGGEPHRSWTDAGATLFIVD